MQLPGYCTYCGVRLPDLGKFCSSCGKEVVAVRAATPVPPPPATVSAPTASAQTPAAPRELAYYYSIQRVVLLTILTLGLYVFYSFYVTWKQYRDQTGRPAFPVAHALSLLVPIYGLFRAHAHVRTYKELMAERGLTAVLNPWPAVIVVVAINTIDWISFTSSFQSGMMTATDTGGTGLLLDAISTGLVAWLLVHIHTGVNQYWVSTPNTVVRSAPISVAEIILSVIGGLSWLSTLSSLAMRGGAGI